MSIDGAPPPEPADLLPERSVLTFEEYMAMQRAVGNETRFRVLYRHKRDGAMSAKELREALLDHGVEELLRREQAFADAYE